MTRRKPKKTLDPVTVRVGLRLRSHRIRLELSIDDVEAATGIDRTSIARYERGEGKTSDERREKLANFYGVSLADLFSR